MKEWCSVKHSPSLTTVTWSAVDGPLSVRWTVKTYPHRIEPAVAEAKKEAHKALAQLRGATA